jgi:hypothetical protein
MSSAHQQSNTPKRATEFVLYSVFVLGEIHLFWDHYRFFSLFLVWVGFVCLLIIDGGVPWRGGSRLSAVVLVICFIVFLFCHLGIRAYTAVDEPFDHRRE